MVSFTLETRSKNKGNNIVAGDKEYGGTPGLWELLAATISDDKNFHQ